MQARLRLTCINGTHIKQIIVVVELIRYVKNVSVPFFKGNFAISINRFVLKDKDVSFESFQFSISEESFFVKRIFSKGIKPSIVIINIKISITIAHFKSLIGMDIKNIA